MHNVGNNPPSTVARTKHPHASCKRIFTGCFGTGLRMEQRMREQVSHLMERLATYAEDRSACILMVLCRIVDVFLVFLPLNLKTKYNTIKEPAGSDLALQIFALPPNCWYPC